MGQPGGRPRVGLIFPLDSQEANELLSEQAEVVLADGYQDAHMSRLLQEVDAVILRSPGRVTAAQLEEPHKVRIIAGLGAGTDNVDSDAATAHGIPVINSSGVSPETIAEYVLGAIAFGRRRLFRANRALLDGLTWSKRLELRGPQVRGSSLGLVGYGHIGRAAARMSIAAFDLVVRAYDPFVTITDTGVEQIADLDELLELSDIVSLHVPLLPQTSGLIGAAQLRRIGPSGLLINASRGAVVDQPALLAALTSGELGGAVVDVYEPEPPDPALIAALAECPTAFLTPHLGGQTFEGHEAREEYVVRQVLGALGGVRPTSLSNPAVMFP